MSKIQTVKQGAESAMEGCLCTSSEDLSKLVSWAHSHGTICTVIPGLKHLLSGGSHGHLTAMWGCSAGHAYHWTLTAACGSRPKEPVCGQDGLHGGASGSQPGSGEKISGRAPKVKRDCVQMRESCDISNCSDPSEVDENTEEYNGMLLDTVCESSATDEDGDYEPQVHHVPRKRVGSKLSHSQSFLQMSEEGLGDSGVKKIKQEMIEDYCAVVSAQLTGCCDSGPSSQSCPRQLPQTHSHGRSSLLHVCRHRPPAADPLSSHLPHSTVTAKGLRGLAPCAQSRQLGNTAPPSPVEMPPRFAPGSTSACSHPARSPVSTLQLPGDGELIEPLDNAELMKAGETSPLYGDSDPSSGIFNPELDASTKQTYNVEPHAEASGSPALLEIEKLKVLLQAERNKSELLEDTVKSLKQDKVLLQQELTKKAEFICDFLQDQLSHHPEKRRGVSAGQPEASSSNQHATAFSDKVATFEPPVLFDSFDEMEMHPSERQKTISCSKRSREGENTRVRMKNVVGVIARYMTALQEFRRSVSMKVAFDRVGVDRNTISRTAAIAELSLAAPEVFHSLAPWDEKEETLAHYATRCRQAMDDNIKAKIKTMKANGDLLPIVSK